MTVPAVTPSRMGSRQTAPQIILGVFVVYVILAVIFAGLLIQDGLRRSPAELEKNAVGSVIVVIGTVATGVAAIYSVNHQSSAARDLALLAYKLNADLETMKAQSSEALERLKASLDLKKTAYRELFGAATTYFYTLRALGSAATWDGEPQKKADALMVEASRHLLYVSDEFRSLWLGFWTEANFIYTGILAEREADTRMANLKAEIEAQVALPRQNIRDWHRGLEEMAKREAQAPLTPTPTGSP
jgi:hypothetical protein